MGIESKEAKQLADEQSPVEALFGSLRKKPQLPYPEQTEFRIFTGCLDDASAKAELEALLTRSFRCQNRLKKAGDVAVLEVSGDPGLPSSCSFLFSILEKS